MSWCPESKPMTIRSMSVTWPVLAIILAYLAAYTLLAVWLHVRLRRIKGN